MIFQSKVLDNRRPRPEISHRDTVPTYTSPSSYHLNVPQKVPHGEISRITIIFSFQPCIVWLARETCFCGAQSRKWGGGTSKPAKLTVGVSVSPFLCISHTSAVHMRSLAILKGLSCGGGRWQGSMIAETSSCSSFRRTRCILQPCPSGLLVVRSIPLALWSGDTVKRQSPHTHGIPDVRPTALLKGKRTRKPRSQYVGNYSVVPCLVTRTSREKWQKLSRLCPNRETALSRSGQKSIHQGCHGAATQSH
jgi:hypothetical protein